MISVVTPVYRDAMRACALVRSLLLQALPSGQSLEIVVVDDGSADGGAELLRQIASEQVRIVSLPRNMGRSAARNAGAELARGEFLAFIDCDCRPIDADFLASHITVLRSGHIASYGSVTGDGRGFWSRYQQEASNRRARQHEQGFSFSGSSQNFAVCRETFRQVGGFDMRYEAYGFEDRDLFGRLSLLGRTSWCPGATVEHLDQLSLPGVLTKMRLAAGTSAALFSRNHAEAYRQLGYAALDVCVHPWLRPAVTLLRPMLHAAPIFDRALHWPWLPYQFGRAIVKASSALAYATGSSER
jgi:glycosyltransferase involved in cell wall biosynthesis